MVKKILICLLTITALYAFGRLYLADIHYKSSRGYLADNKSKEAYKQALFAKKLNPFEPAYYLQAFRTNPADKKVLEEAIELNPNNLATIRNAIPLYASLDKTVARAYFADVKSAYSTDVGILVQIGKYEKKVSLESDFIKTTQMIRELRPDLLDWHPDLN